MDLPPWLKEEVSKINLPRVLQDPIPPSEDSLTRWRHATTSPSTLPEEDRLLILRRWPKEDFDTKCLTKCGITLEQLLDKATDDQDSLTSTEAKIITSGVDLAEPREDYIATDILKWPGGTRDLYHAAQKIVETERERQARENAEKASYRWFQVEQNAKARLSDDDTRNIRLTSRLNWAAELDKEPERQWGFVGFRTTFGDEVAWEGFKRSLEDCVETALFVVRDSDRMRKRWHIEWVEDRELEGASLSQLCEAFRSLSPTLTPGLRKDVFLHADTSALSSTTNKTLPLSGWIWTVDPTFTEAKKRTYQHGFEGSLKVSLIHISTAFFSRLDQNESNPRRMKQSLQSMYLKAGYDQGERVYPPTSRFNRDLAMD